MKHVVEAGTDAASLLLFDPAALPAHFDSMTANDPAEILSQLDEEGRLFWINTDGDGRYLLHAYVDEQPDEQFRQFMKDPRVSDSFTVAGESVYFAGAEYAFKEDDSRYQAYPHMGGPFPIENGTYRVALYRTEYPEGLLEESFRKRVSPTQYFVHQSFSWFMATGVISVIVLLASLIFASWEVWIAFMLPLAVLVILLLIGLNRVPVYQAANNVWRQVQREFPSIVATLHTKKAS